MKTGISRTLLKLTGAIGIAMLLASPGIYADEANLDEAQPSVVSTPENTADETPGESLKDKLLNHESDSQTDSIGMSEVPQFESHGVIRGEAKDNTPYLMLGYNPGDLVSEEDETTADQNDNGFSYGIGVSKNSSNIEYMMQVDQDDHSAESIGIRFTSNF